MTPYYSQDGITIYHADCRDVLPSLPKADLVLTDPPYGVGDHWLGGGGKGRSSWKFDPAEAMAWDMRPEGIVEELPALARYAVIWGGNYFSLPPSRCWFLWDKKMNDAWSTSQAEMAWTNIDRPVRVFRMAQGEAHSEMRGKEHPTQKPESLIRWCIAMAPADCALICDPFMGSGTTLVAAKYLGRRAIGIEIDERYCEIAVNRLQQAVLPLEAGA